MHFDQQINVAIEPVALIAEEVFDDVMSCVPSSRLLPLLRPRSAVRPFPRARVEIETSFRLAGSARLLQTFRRIFSIGLPLASSSISLSR